MASTSGATNQGDPIAVVVAVAALIVVVVGAGLLVMQVRARLLRKHDDRASTESWLDELRAMHRRGEVSDEEFQSARASLLAKVTGAPVPGAPGSVGSARAPDPSARVAKPGFDLTGAPLPPFGGPIAERSGQGPSASSSTESSPDDPPPSAG